MNQIKKIVCLFLMVMLGFIISVKTISAKSIEDKKSKNDFAVIQLTQDNGEDDEDTLPQDDEDSDIPKESGDENSDDNSVDEYNYGDED